MPTVVIGTAGHIDHGKTTLLQALTGIDADRLPEERERGMTIDVGFAHLDLADGTTLDFVDVPGHDRLVGNMLVGAGEIDAVLLVVAADDGPRAQTLEHLALLDALGLLRAVVAITKIDAVDPVRVQEVAATARTVVDRTAFGGASVIRVSAVSGEGLAELREALLAMRIGVMADLGAMPAGPVRLPIDRVFTVRGRGLVITGTLRGGSVRAGDVLRLEPGGIAVRVREVQVHHGRADSSEGGRTALNLVGADAEGLRRGVVVTGGAGLVASDRALVALQPASIVAASVSGAGRGTSWPPSASAVFSLHLWTETVEASIRAAARVWTSLPDGGLVGVVRLGRPVALMAGARGVLRDPGSGRIVGGVTVLDPRPPRGASRRRVTPERLIALAGAVEGAVAGAGAAAGGAPAGGAPIHAVSSGANVAADAAADALTDLHGAVDPSHHEALAGAIGSGSNGAPTPAGRSRAAALSLAPDVAAALQAAALELAPGRRTLAELRAVLLARLRRLATIDRDALPLAASSIDRIVDELVDAGGIGRDGDRIVPARSGDAADAEVAAREQALARLEAALDVDVPPSLSDAIRASGAPPDAIAALERSGRIVRVDDDLAWAAGRYATLRGRAVDMARVAPVTPAAFRDAIGGNRRVALAFLEDLGRKGVLRRTDTGHVLGPRA